jgi:peptidoglycan hydrolase-like protein with peptidoglycan-binding domain
MTKHPPSQQGPAAELAAVMSESSRRRYEQSSGPAIPIIAIVERPSGAINQPGARPILRQGARGPAVEDLQDRLRELGEPLIIDGVFGHRTRTAVIRLQHANGINPDGIVGAMTWSVLDAIPVHIPELAIDDAASLSAESERERERTTLDGVGDFPGSSGRR